MTLERTEILRLFRICDFAKCLQKCFKLFESQFDWALRLVDEKERNVFFFKKCFLFLLVLIPKSLLKTCCLLLYIDLVYPCKCFLVHTIIEILDAVDYAFS